MPTEAQNIVERWPNSKLAVLLFIISEGTFFAFLIIGYVYYHSIDNTGLVAARVLDPRVTGVFSIFLISSSFTVWRAERSLRRGDPAAFRRWLMVTMAFGAIFLIGQGREYLHLYAENVTISRDIFGTSFFTLTGFHGLHVFLGLIALGVILALAMQGGLEGEHASAVEAVTLYWHFVDWVWVVIFMVVYLWAGF